MNEEEIERICEASVKLYALNPSKHPFYIIKECADIFGDKRFSNDVLSKIRIHLDKMSHEHTFGIIGE